MRTLLWFGLLFGTVPSAVGQQPPGPQRPYRIDDYLSTETVLDGSVTVAPDGQAVAWTRQRAANTQITNSLGIEEARGDIWLQEAPGRPARNLTNGLADSSGWWAPQWSSDGRWLAILSSRGGEVRLWGWERARNQLRLLSPSGVGFAENGGCRWVDAHRLLCLMLSEGERSTPTHGYYGKPVERAEAAWARAKRGELTASVVHSLEFRLPHRRLLVVDVTTGREQVLATTQIDPWESGSPFWLSPTGQAVAFVRPGAATYPSQQRWQMGYPATVELRRLDGRPLRLSQPLPANVVTSTLQWSPDGQALLFFALGDALIHPELLYGEGAGEVRYPAVASKDYPGQLWRVDLARGVVERLKTGDLDLGQGATPPAFLWMARGDLLFRAPRLFQGARPLTPAQLTWLVLGRDGRTRALVPNGQRLPESLEPIDDGVAFLGLMDGEVWRVDPIKGTLKNLTASFGPQVNGMQPVGGAKSTTHLVVSSDPTPQSEWEKLLMRGDGQGVAYLRDYVLLDLTSGATIPLRKPGPRAAVVTYDGVSQSALWLANDREGTFLWRSVEPRPPEQLVATNMFLKEVAQGEERIIEYTTLNGERMQARLVLPPGYEPGRRYPLVVDFDIGYTPEGGTSLLTVKDPWALNGQYDLYGAQFPSAGYVYMFASWPDESMDQIGRGNMLLGPNGILPAVDEVIRLGIADPERLFLFGSSSAGYGVFALVTQTSRFKAAAAHAGWVDNITERLTLNIMERYAENPFDWARLGGARYIRSPLPFWRNGENYRRNSPLSYVDRVQTPLLILHGDLDLIPITEPEMFFKALVMQRKPAQFVRYWGEGHGNQTPINVRDYWQRIFAWYDQWGDIARDANGNMLFDRDRVKSRQGAPALRPEEYAKFPLFGPGGMAARSEAASN